MVESNGDLIPLEAFLSSYLISLLDLELFLSGFVQSSDLPGLFTSPY